MGKSKFDRIAVYCGASSGKSDAYAEAARALGEEMSRRGIKLTYGGGSSGLMGEIGRAVAAGLGSDSVLGIIPPALEAAEVSGPAVGKVMSVKDIHERKAKMAENADAFIALPGGYGTLEELLEMITWQQLGFHTKPVGLLNVNGYFNHFISFVDHMVKEGFVRERGRQIILEGRSPSELLDKLETYSAGEPLVTILARENEARRANGTPKS